MSDASTAVSVVIPTYNAEGFLADTLESVLAQGWSRLEVVVVDDGSTDGTPSLLRSYVARYPEIIRVVSQENQGPAAARNAGILASKHPLIAMLDHDDRWLPQKLERQVPFLMPSSDLEFCATGNLDIFEGAGSHESIIYGWDDAPDSVLHRLLVQNCILTSTLLATRRALIEVGLFDRSIWWGDEYDLWLRIAAAGYRIGYLPEALTVHTFGPEHLSSWFNERGIDAYLPAMKRRFDAGDMPPTIQSRKRWYIAHRSLNNAVAYLEGGHYGRAISALAHALWTRPMSARPGWVRMLGKAILGLIRSPCNCVSQPLITRP